MTIEVDQLSKMKNIGTNIIEGNLVMAKSALFIPTDEIRIPVA